MNSSSRVAVGSMIARAMSSPHPFPFGVRHVAESRDTPFDVLGEAVRRVIDLDAGVVEEREHRHVLEDGVGVFSIGHAIKVRARFPRTHRWDVRRIIYRRSVGRRGERPTKEQREWHPTLAAYEGPTGTWQMIDAQDRRTAPSRSVGSNDTPLALSRRCAGQCFGGAASQSS